jgi:hypothetical protein
MLLSDTLLAITLFAFPDTTVTLRSCGSPRTLRSSGEVAFLLDRRGRVSPSNIKILGVTGSSAEGFRSALVRQLPACRFEPESRTERWVRGILAFDGHTLSLRSAVVVASPPDSVSFSPTPVADRVYDSSSPALDELPRELNCQLIPRDEVTTRTRVDGQVVSPPPVPNLPPRPKSGEVHLSYEVDQQGRIRQNSFGYFGRSDPELVSAAVARLEACRFAPGKVAGKQVSVRVTSVERF